MANKDINKIAVVYARYSSSGQKEQSIDGQIAAAQKYAELKGYTIIHEYVDRAMTGRSDNRDDFQRMLSDTAKKSFGVIIVWKVDRFGRNREEITFNKYRCKKNGVRVEYVAENMPDGPESVILESVLEGMAEYYSLQLSQNVKRGLLENAKAHRAVNGSPPFGYRLTPDKHFEIDPDTAPIAKLIFEKYASGQTAFEIIKYLNDKGYRTPRKLPFSKSSLQHMLKNEKYIGVYVYKDIIYDEDAVPAIVDKETFYKVQSMLKTNRRAPKAAWNYSDYLLTDKLFCGLCGEKMVGESGFGKAKKKYSYYSCLNRKHNKGCKKKPVRQDFIENLVLNEIQRILEDDNLLEYIAEQTWQYYLKQDESRKEIEAMQTQLVDAEKGLKNLVKAVEDGMPYSMAKDRIDGLEGQIAALQKAIAEKKLSLGFKLTKDHIIYFLEQFRKLDVTDRDCQKRLVKTFVNAIYLYDDGRIKIAYNYTGNNNTVTLESIEKTTTSDVFGCGGLSVREATVSEHPALALRPKSISWLLGAFIIIYEIPQVN